MTTMGQRRVLDPELVASHDADVCGVPATGGGVPAGLTMSAWFDGVGTEAAMGFEPLGVETPPGSEMGI
jgi:hypothetical protein